jgi:hypothetical protein
VTNARSATCDNALPGALVMANVAGATGAGPGQRLDQLRCLTGLGNRDNEGVIQGDAAPVLRGDAWREGCRRPTGADLDQISPVRRSIVGGSAGSKEHLRARQGKGAEVPRQRA